MKIDYRCCCGSKISLEDDHFDESTRACLSQLAEFKDKHSDCLAKQWGERKAYQPK